MVSYATHIGRHHRLHRRNNQDAAFGRQLTPTHAYGMVLDGCGSPYRSGAAPLRSQNDVGSRLLGQIAAAYLEQHLTSAASIASLLAGLDRCLDNRLMGLARAIIGNDVSQWAPFIATHLLATVVGFVVVHNRFAHFWCGDGFLLTPTECRPLESDNRPDYVAYRLLATTILSRLQWRVSDGDTLPAWLGVATDGWRRDQLSTLGAARSSLKLQRHLNVLGRDRDYFNDDAGIALWFRDNNHE